MTTVRVRFTPNNVPTPGRIRFQARHDKDTRPIVSGRDILNANADYIPVPVEGAEIEVRPQDAGWHYVIRAQADGGPTVSGTFLIPANGPVDFQDLVRYDPKAGMAYEPDPDWYAHLNAIENGIGGVQAELTEAVAIAQNAATNAADTIRGEVSADAATASTAASNAATIKGDLEQIFLGGTEAVNDAATATFVGSAGTQTRGEVFSAVGRAQGVVSASLPPYNVGASRTGSQNLAGVMQAISDATALGYDVLLPAGSWDLSGTVAIDSPNLRIYGAGKYKTRIRQTVKPAPAFFLRSGAKGVFTGGYTVIGDGLNMTGHTVGAYQRYCAVRVHPEAHGSTVADVHGEDIYMTLRVGGDHRGDPDFPAPLDSPSLEKFTAQGISGEGVWCVVFGGTLKDSSIDKVSGSYMKAFGSGVDTGQPPHLIYLYSPSREAAPSEGIYSENVNISNLLGYDSSGQPGAVFAPKYIRGLNAQNISGRNCQGILDLIALEDSIISGVTSIEDCYPSAGEGSSRASIAIKECTRTDVVDASVKFKHGDHGKAIFTEAFSVDCTINGVRVTANHSVGELTGGRSDVRISGTRSTIEGLVMENLGETIAEGVLIVGTGSGGKLVNPKIKGGYRQTIRVASNNIGAFVEYDPALCVPNFGVASAVALRLDTSAVVTVRDRSAGSALPGFVDDFQRPDALALGLTQDGKPWIANNSSGTSGRFAVSGGKAVANSSINGALYEVVNAGANSGELVAQLAGLGDSLGGLILHYGDTANQVQLNTRVSAGDNRYRIARRAAGSLSAVATSSVTPQVGDNIRIVLAGDSVQVFVNNTDIFGGAQTLPTGSTFPFKGLLGQSGGANASWESIKFTV